MRGLTSNNDAEIRECVQMLVKRMVEQDLCMNLSIKMIRQTSPVNGLPGQIRYLVNSSGKHIMRSLIY